MIHIEIDLELSSKALGDLGCVGFLVSGAI